MRAVHGRESEPGMRVLINFDTLDLAVLIPTIGG
jgi:hypothetical protein